MLHSLSQQINDCLHRAAECRARAEQSVDESARRHDLDEAQRWLSLARRYESELLQPSAAPANARGAALHPAIPRVMCPQCGSHMRLERIVPCATPGRRAETVSFTCTCRFTLQQTIDKLG